MKRTLSAAAILLLLAGTAFGWPLARVWKGGPPWWSGGLTFWAPFDNPDNPLALNVGTGSLSFTRATTATYVHPTTGLITSAASGQLRIESNGALIEGQRTNLHLWSEKFTVATGAWTGLTRCTGINDNTIAPDGTLTADFLKEDGTASSNHRIYEARSGLTDNTVYTWSVYLKGGTRTFSTVALSGKTGSGTCNLNINLSTCAYQSSGTCSGTPTAVTAPNGFCQAMVSKDVSTGASLPNTTVFIDNALGNGTYSGDNTSGIYIWGAQLEAASFASSYIPTVAEAVTRNASVLTEQTASNIDNVDGTIALQWTPKYASTVAVGTATLFDAGGIRATYTSADRKINLTDGTNTVSSAAIAFSANVAQKLAFRWGPSGLLVYKDGTEAATGATYTAGAFNANLYFGANVSSENHAYSNIKPTRTWNREFSATEMGSITQ